MILEKRQIINLEKLYYNIVNRKYNRKKTQK